MLTFVAEFKSQCALYSDQLAQERKIHEEQVSNQSFCLLGWYKPGTFLDERSSKNVGKWKKSTWETGATLQYKNFKTTTGHNWTMM